VARVSQSDDRALRPDATYSSESPKNRIVHQQPGLFAEPGNILPLLDTASLGKGREEILHRRGAETGEQEDAKQDEVAIVPAKRVFPCLGIEVGKGEVFARVGAGAGHAVGEEEQGDEVEGEAWEGVSTSRSS